MQTQHTNYKTNPLNEKIEISRLICSFKDLQSFSPQQIAIYGGSFDPPQLAHLASIKKLAATNQIVVVMPLGKNPYKPLQPFATNLQRLQMLDMMLSGINNVFICTEEIERANRTQQTTRTVDTLRLARKELPDTQVRLVIGADCLQKLHLWNNFEDIFQIADPVVFQRPGYKIENLEELANNLGWNLVNKIRANILETGISQDVSSTAVREALKKGDRDTLGSFLHPDVSKYIRENGIYADSGEI